MHTTLQERERNRAKIIFEEASKLSVSSQEQVLEVMKGMLFTRSCFAEKEGEKT